MNPKFTRTVDLEMLRRLLERHRADLDLDLDLLHHDSDGGRRAIQEFFAGPEEHYPESLVADLHQIAELGTEHGLQIILEQCARVGILIEPAQEDGERRQDPKHVAVFVFLHHRAVFDAASDMMALSARSSLAEFAGRDEGVEAVIDECAKNQFETAAATMFEADLHGRYCRIGWYDDDDELNVVVTHGSTVTTTQVVENGEEAVISYRATAHAMLSYAATAGRLKIGGVRKARLADIAELFAGTILRRPGFFADAGAQNLYTLEPIERAGFGFTFDHAFDPGIERVQIVEVQLDRVDTDPRTGETRAFWSTLARDSRDNALARLGKIMRHRRMGLGWRLNHIVARIQFRTGGTRPAKVTVKIKPPGSVNFKRHRFEGRIMTLLRRNGLMNDRDAAQAAVAAE